MNRNAFSAFELSGQAFVFAAIVLLGLWGGYQASERFGVAPYGELAGVLLGVFLAFFQSYQWLQKRLKR